MAMKHNKAATKAFRDFADWTPTTSIHKSVRDAVTAAILGVGGELNEYFETIETREGVLVGYSVISDLKKEMGDVLYYMGLIATHLGLSATVTVRNRQRLNFGNQWYKEVFHLQELYKKMIRDNDGELDYYAKKEEFVQVYRSLLDYLFEEVAMNSWNWKDILSDNQEKLISRMERGKITGSGNNR